jgi:hypothetical protein
MDQDEKARINRLRRKAARQGWDLHKTRRMDSDASDYGTYQLTDAKGRRKNFRSIDAVEQFLTR